MGPDQKIKPRTLLDYMNDLTEMQRKVLDVVYQHSESNPITGAVIANRIGMKPRDTGKEGADLRAVINALRQKGYPIAASGAGYFFVRNSYELSEYIKSLKGRAEKIMQAAEGLQHCDKFNYEPTPAGTLFS